MGLIRFFKIRFAAVLILGIIPFSVLSGQEAKLFASEIQELEKILEGSASSGADRRDAYKRIARLLQAAGNIEGAAEAWSGAAYAEQGKRDDGALLSAVRCLMALGEWGKAEAGVKAVLLTGRDRGNLLTARYLGAQVEAFQTKSGDHSALASFLDDPDYEDQKSMTYYLLWVVSGNESYKTKLLREYPRSPEAIAAADSQNDRVSAAPGALLILFPGRDSITLGTPVPSAPSAEKPPETTASAGPAAAQPPAPEPSPAAAGPQALQVGLYSREENAKAMAARLTEAGFTASVSERLVNNNRYWAVTTPPGRDYNETLLRLKDAGFESFPVF
ncbi:SPOR domain-containing protein [Breznakiella homolactica]|uniref:SPOR domain-containing protein n=1 Tax=Breznakiella homolactica TaxID=2798577 RepID=A0A7T7XJH1_9SPIR|nr:SPOR domain-containing protein [Breznakiella homolactica]QQO07545.1 SPOR domain-containing protein [Breznakiella homolactica]